MGKTNRDVVEHSAAFDAYCIRHAVTPRDAFTELVNMALGLPVDVLDYLRDQRRSNGTAA